MLFSEFYKIMEIKVSFVSSVGGYGPNRPLKPTKVTSFTIILWHHVRNSTILHVTEYNDPIMFMVQWCLHWSGHVHRMWGGLPEDILCCEFHTRHVELTFPSYFTKTISCVTWLVFRIIAVRINTFWGSRQMGPYLEWRNFNFSHNLRERNNCRPTENLEDWFSKLRQHTITQQSWLLCKIPFTHNKNISVTALLYNGPNLKFLSSS